MENLLSTKFIFSVLAVALAFVLTILGKLTPEFVTFVGVIGGTFVAGNVISGISYDKSVTTK